MPKAERIYVALDGSDDARGTRRRPLATLHAALDLARRLGNEEPRSIVLRAGDYALDRPLDLDERDSRLTIEPHRDEAATVYGGRRVTGWRRDGDRFWAADAADADFRMLVVNGRFCPRARWPKAGHFTHLSSFTVPWMSTTGGGWKRKPTTEELTTLVYRPGDLGPWLEVRNAELTVYHMWDESVVGLTAHDPKTHTLTFSTPAGHPPGAFGVKKYVVWNVRRGMAEPGQWYLDRTAGKVVYWPLPGEDMATATVLAPTVESIIRIRGKTYDPARDITIRGIRLSVTDTPLEAGGFGAGKFAGAIDLLNTDSCTLRDLEIVHVGGQGIKEWGGRGLRVERCHIHHVGACGIKVGGAATEVADCHIHHVGLTYPSAIALWGGGKHDRGCTFTHNEIHDTPYTAIACGGDHHVIEHNLLYRAMQQLHDGAAIYITFAKRVTVRGNFVRDIVDTGGYGASAYYLDEQAEDCLVQGNLSLGVKRPSHNHMARRNHICNNVFIVDGDATLTFPKSTGYSFEKNIVVATGTITFTNPDALDSFADNILHSGTGKILGQPLRADPQPLKPGKGTIFADPALLESEYGIVRFAPSSPAHKLAIEPLDVSAAGPR